MPRLPSYTEIAATIGLRRCRGITPTGHRCFNNHEGTSPGLSWDEADGTWTLHLEERRPSRIGIYRFLYVAAKTLPEVQGATQVWYAMYLQMRAVPRLAQHVRVFLPKSTSDDYRVALRKIVVRERPSPERREAMRWLSK